MNSQAAHFKSKIFNDPVHGNISIHPLCVKIIDTPQFQRLRQIKQLGAVQFVYPGATHSRFEHSVGTCHLAGEWFKHLKETLPDSYSDDLKPEDGLCVMIAGLCHDLGHGPFSHVFEKFYMKQVRASKEMSHEELSVKMLRHLIERNNLRPAMEEYGLADAHINLISDFINPTRKYGEEYEQTKKRMFLYEIVNNKENGIDVDKWDYFARDCLHVNITNSFDYRRLVKFSRVLAEEDGSTHICFRDKEAENLYKMFELRYDLHRQVYSHKVCHVIHLMLSDVLLKANGHLHLLIPDVQQLWILEGQEHQRTAASFVDNMEVFSKLTDTAIWHILLSDQEELAASKKILTCIQSRRFYPSFRTCPSERKAKNELDVKHDLFKLTNEELVKRNAEVLTEENKRDLVVFFIDLDYSKGDKDPIHDVRFYEKSETPKIIKLQEYKKLRLPPKQFSQHIVSVCWKCLDHEEYRSKVSCLKEAFVSWCKKEGFVHYE